MHTPKLADERMYQEINIWSKKGMRIEIQICQIKMKYELEVNRRTEAFDPVFNSSVCNKYYNTVAEAFEDGFIRAQKYILNKGDSIDKIDNPCNDEFIDWHEEQSILNKIKIDAPIFVNGKLMTS